MMPGAKRNIIARDRSGKIIKTFENPASSFLRKELGRLGLSQKDASGYIHIPQGHLSDMIRGTRGIGISVALKLEKAFGVNAEKIFVMQAKYDIGIARQDARIKKKLDKVTQFKKKQKK